MQVAPRDKVEDDYNVAWGLEGILHVYNEGVVAGGKHELFGFEGSNVRTKVRQEGRLQLNLHRQVLPGGFLWRRCVRSDGLVKGKLSRQFPPVFLLIIISFSTFLLLLSSHLARMHNSAKASLPELGHVIKVRSSNEVVRPAVGDLVLPVLRTLPKGQIRRS